MIYRDAVVTNSHGQAVAHTYVGGSRTYVYDHVGRLSTAAEQVDGTGCTTRSYGYDDRSNRQSRTTYLPDIDGTCRWSGTPDAQTSHSVDSADRLVDTGYTYDPFGRITALPGGLTNTFYANDLIASQVLDNARQDWTLDPKYRARGFAAASYDGSNWTTTASRLNHYGDDSDKPRWIVEDTTTGALTRLVSGPDAILAATTTATGDARFTIVNLHGDIITTTDTTAMPASLNHFDEFGAPTTGQTPTRYGWLGGHQRSAEAIGGTILMSVRLYHPDTGRFLQPDPVDGGSATAYDYCSADPVNCTDLDGRWGLKSIVNAVANVTNAVTNVVSNAASTVQSVVATASHAVTSAVSTAGNTLGQAASSAWSWAKENRGLLATVAATAACFAPAVGWAACAGLQAAAFAVRAQQRIQKEGFKGSLQSNIFDATVTVSTVGLGGFFRAFQFGKFGGVKGAWSPFGKLARAAQTEAYRSATFHIGRIPVPMGSVANVAVRVGPFFYARQLRRQEWGE